MGNPISAINASLLVTIPVIGSKILHAVFVLKVSNVRVLLYSNYSADYLFSSALNHLSCREACFGWQSSKGKDVQNDTLISK